MDLPLVGYIYTWTKSRGKEHAVEVHLNRALMNPGWLDLFRNATLATTMPSKKEQFSRLNSKIDGLERMILTR